MNDAYAGGVLDFGGKNVGTPITSITMATPLAALASSRFTHLISKLLIYFPVGAAIDLLVDLCLL